MELRPLNEILEEIRATFDRADTLGVQGFKIAVRTKRSQLIMEWGSTKQQKLIRPKKNEAARTN